MKINNTKRVKQKIESLLEIHMISGIVNIVLTNQIDSSSVIPTDIEGLRKEADELNDKMKNNGIEPYQTEKTMI